MIVSKWLFVGDRDPIAYLTDLSSNAYANEICFATEQNKSENEYFSDVDSSSDSNSIIENLNNKNHYYIKNVNSRVV